MKIYVAHNLDGVNMAAVVAARIKIAADRMGTSVYDLRRYGWHQAKDSEAAEILSFPHSEVLYKPIDDYPPHTFWRPLRRWSSSEVREALAKARRTHGQ